MIVKSYPKENQPVFQQRKINLPSCPRCRINNWTEFSHGYICRSPECELNIKMQKHQIDEKYLRQDHNFSIRLVYASKQIANIIFAMGIIHFKTTEVMITKLQSLKGQTKLKSYQNFSSYYHEMNYHRQNGTFQFTEDPFNRNVHCFSKFYYEVLLLMK